MGYPTDENLIRLIKSRAVERQFFCTFRLHILNSRKVVAGKFKKISLHLVVFKHTMCCEYLVLHIRKHVAPEIFTINLYYTYILKLSSFVHRVMCFEILIEKHWEV